MTDYLLKAGSTSQINSNQHVPIINIATNRLIGYVSGEYLNTRARVGFIFLHDEKLWKILHITDGETILVLPDKNLGDIARLNLETQEDGLKKESSDSLHGLPTPSNELILLESFEDYIIIHTAFGLMINTTLRLVLDAMLTEQDLIRDTCNDALRILIRAPIELTRDEVESIRVDLLHVTSREFDRFLLKAIDARFPYVVSNENRPQKKTQVEKTLKGELRAKLAAGQSKAFFRRLAQGGIRTLTHYSTVRPTQSAKEIIDKYLEIKAVEFDTLVTENATDLKQSIEERAVELVCLKCLSTQTPMRISQISERPKCEKCGSGLLGLPVIPVQTTQNLLRKKKSKKLSQAETEQLAAARRTADLILAYGKKAIIALSVTGIGPQTASSILASMPNNVSEFYSDILRARIHYLTTRELWDRKHRRISY